jgi:predicted Zn-dependent peptidase
VRLFARSFLLAWLAAAPALAAVAPDSRPASAYFVLDNGLQVLLQEKRGLPLTGIALAIDLGTKDENEETGGYVHLLEHMLLFGDGSELDSEARLAALRGRGVEQNAHTDHDLMTFEVSCPAEESAWALEQVRLAVFAPRLEARRLEAEKRIIREELLQRRDDPLGLGQLLVMERLFAGHPYGRSVFGEEANIAAATVEKLRAFCRPHLVPDRCALALVGDFAVAGMESEVRRRWGTLARGETAAAALPAAGRLQKSSEHQVELDVEESHLFIGWRAPAFNDGERLPFSLLAHLLGGGINPILNGVLRGGRRLADRVSMSYLPMRAGGVALLHLTLERRKIRAAQGEISSFLSRIGSFHFSPGDVPPRLRQGMLDYLQSAKNQMEYGNGSFRESALNLSLASARFLLLNRNSVAGSFLDSIGGVSACDLRRAAGRYLSGKKWVVVAVTPRGKDKE